MVPGRSGDAGTGESSLCGCDLTSLDHGTQQTQALLSAAQEMELQRRDYHVERPLLTQGQLEDLGHWGPVPKTYQWRAWFR